jgi:hypothetical protein
MITTNTAPTRKASRLKGGQLKSCGHEDAAEREVGAQLAHGVIEGASFEHAGGGTGISPIS